MNPFRILFTVTLLFLAPCVLAQDATPASSLVGAWRIAGEPERVMIVTPNYWAQTIYHLAQREFIRTFGGTYAVNGETADGRIEFDSEEPQRVGESFRVRSQVDENSLRLIQEDGSEEIWTRIDAGENALAGTWRISGRQVDGAFREMPLRARRTLKLLSGTRFQWIAINIESGEFSGTGGGTYTFEKGNYIEHIEFFSRDGARVGARLEFNGDVSGDTWRHRGLSSRGDPIDEVWTRFDPADDDAAARASSARR